MKKLALLTLVSIFVFACQTTDPEQEITSAENSLNAFYTAMENFDYNAMRTLATPDFSVFETGFDHSDIEGFIASVKSMEGATVKTTLDFKNAEVSGNMAFVVLNFHATITFGAANMNVDAYENYILKKEGGKWLLHYVHSTHLPDPSDNNLASLHLLKVPEDLSLEELQNGINNLNQAIAETGFWDCGYTIMQVVPGSSNTYNYFIRGNWKNQKTYDIIHESEGFKNASNSLSEGASKFFIGQLYVKITDL